MKMFDDLQMNIYEPEVSKSSGWTKLRTIKECYQIIKFDDPGTAITPYFIRTLCQSGKVDYITTGKKILVYLDSLLNTLNITA